MRRNDGGPWTLAGELPGQQCWRVMCWVSAARADHRGRAEHPASEEEPGRILHEMRFGPAASLTLGGGSVYYATVDATSLFVMLLRGLPTGGRLRRWGSARVSR